MGGDHHLKIQALQFSPKSIICLVLIKFPIPCRPWVGSLWVCAKLVLGAVLMSSTVLRNVCCRLCHSKCKQSSCHYEKAAMIPVSYKTVPSRI